MKQRMEVVGAVLAAAFRNKNLRDIGVAYALFSASEFGVWIVLLVFAFDRGGVSAELLITLVQLLPCVVLAPAIGAVADLWDPGRALVAGYGIQALTIGGVALALALEAPTFVIYLLAPLTALSFCMTRPPQSALFPSVVRTPDELTTANVMTGWTEGAAALVGPAIAGGLLAVSGETAAIAAMAGFNLLSMVLALRVTHSLGPIKRHVEDDRPQTTAKSFIDGIRGNLVGVLMNPDIRVLLVLTTFYFVLVGSLDFLCVILALGILHMGPGGAGYLNAAIGAGELVAGFVTAFLIGRRRLVRTLVLSLLGWVCAVFRRFFSIRELFANVFALTGSWYLIALGTVAVVTVLVAPTGIWPVMRSRLGFDWLSVKRDVPYSYAKDALNYTGLKQINQTQIS